MMARVGFLGGRALAAAIFLLTWAYGVTTYSPFAFDMFVGPRLFPQLETFVTWHHLFYWIGFLAGAATLVPDLRAARRGAAWWAAASYVVVFGGIGLYLLGTPYLAQLSRESRSQVAVTGALLPLLWLAVVDHLATTGRRPSGRASAPGAVAGAALATAAYLWLAHLAMSWRAGRLSGEWHAVLAGTSWALALDLALLAVVTAVLMPVLAAAAGRAQALAIELWLLTLLAAAGITELWRRIILPSFSFEPGDALLVATGLGITLAVTWSGLAVRRPPHAGDTALVLLTSVTRGRRGAGVLVAVAVPLAAAFAVNQVEQIDWAYILHSVIALTEGVLVFGIVLGLLTRDGEASWSPALVGAPALAALVVLHTLPSASGALATATGQPAWEPRVVIDRLAATDPLASFAAARFITRPPFDVGYFREVLATESRPSTVDPAVPARTLVAPVTPPAAAPHVFVFVIDSLRRDYLSPYNPAVSFTPAIDAWARESFVFKNAFTAYGGTWLAMPSIWTGSAVTRGWGRIFSRVNALEHLVAGAGFDFVINDFTVANMLRSNLPRTFLDPEIPSVETDLCRNLQSLEARLDGRPAGAPPLFAYLAPMNVHILNTRIESDEARGRYPGFYPPYASRVERMDGCFGAFIQTLKARGLYDNSLIVLTSDHGDTLGEEGRWGHQFYLFPETIRLPLVVSLPRPQRTMVTADLGRVAFLWDLTPTLAALLGQPVPDLGPLFGAPLFVPASEEPRPRRRESFLVMSSYGSTYGLLSRNGRFLYISDLLNWREYAFTLFHGPDGREVPVSGAVRAVNQDRIRRQLGQVDALFRR